MNRCLGAIQKKQRKTATPNCHFLSGEVLVTLPGPCWRFLKHKNLFRMPKRAKEQRPSTTPEASATSAFAHNAMSKSHVSHSKSSPALPADQLRKCSTLPKILSL